MAQGETVTVTTSDESAELIEQLQKIIIAANPTNHQACCISAEFMVWVILASSDTEQEAVECATDMFAPLIENIRENFAASKARKDLIRELEAGGDDVPKWIN